MCKHRDGSNDNNFGVVEENDFVIGEDEEGRVHIEEEVVGGVPARVVRSSSQ